MCDDHEDELPVEEDESYDEMSDSGRLIVVDRELGTLCVSLMHPMDLLQEHEHVQVYNVVRLGLENLSLGQQHLRYALELLGRPVDELSR